MAPSAKFMSFLLLLTLFSSMQTHARESQFFSKVTNVNNNAKETTLPNKAETLSKQEEEPIFIPETQGGYGLYGPESDKLPPTSTSLTNVNGAPYTATPTNIPSNEFEDEESLNKYLNTNFNYNTNTNTDNDNNNKKYYYYNKNRYDANENDPTRTRLTGREYTTTGNQNNYYNGANSYNVEKQGMSDTRFLENGKYYYDLDNENYNPNRYGNSRGVRSRNGYGNKGYYGNNENSFEYKNSLEGYQNDEEFQEGKDEFVP